MTSRKDISVRVRLAVEGDLHYIIKCWRETDSRCSPWANMIPNEIYHSHHRKVIESLLGSATTMVACNSQDATHIVGFMCYERIRGQLVIHYIFTRYALRRWRIASKLLDATGWQEGGPIVCTHWTRYTSHFPDRYRLVYNPYLLFQQFRERLGDGTA